MAVAFDAVGPSAAGAGASGATATLTWQHTCSGVGRVLLVGVTAGRASSPLPGITSVTYAGQALSSVGKQSVDSGLGYEELFVLLDPPAGTGDVVVTREAGSDTFLQCGSVSLTGAGQVADPVAARAKTLTVPGTAADSVVVDLFVAGNNIGTSSQTLRWNLDQENSSTDGGNGAQSTGPGGGDVTVGYTTSSGHFALMAVEVLATPPPNTLAGVVPALTGSLAGESAAAPVPFLARVSGSGRNFLDHDGQPFLVLGDTAWGLPFNAGRWNGGDITGAIDTYIATRAAQGYNVVYFAALGSVTNGGVSDDGSTWDGQSPWDGQIGALNDAYWQRVDRIVQQAQAHGVTCWFDAIYGQDFTAPLDGATTEQLAAYGTALGQRYRDYPNIVWALGGDYFDDDLPGMDAWLAALRGAGDTHLVSIENYAETTSRFDSEGSVRQWGTSNAQYSTVYSYNVTYYECEKAWQETPVMPVLRVDGLYEQDIDDKVMRQLMWWALTSGSQGFVNGTRGVSGWEETAPGRITSDTWSAVVMPAIDGAFRPLEGWHLLEPDLDSSFVLSGRGTHADALPSGGGHEYDHQSPQDTWVTAGIAADGSLAVVFCPVAATITVDETKLVTGYTATWVDPVTGDATPATPAASYTTPPANSAGDTDWALVLTAPPPAVAVEGDLSGQLPVLAGSVAGSVAVAGGVEGSLPAPAGSAAAAVGVAGGVGGALPAPGGSASGSVTVAGGAAGVLPGLAGALTGGVEQPGGTFAGTLPALDGGFTIAVAAAGTLDGALPALAGTFTAAAEITGHLAGSLPTVAGAVTGRAEVSGTTAGSLPALTGALDASVAQQPGTLVGLLPAPAGALAGHVTAAGTLAGGLPALTGQAAGTVRVPGRGPATTPGLTVTVPAAELTVAVALPAAVLSVEVARGEAG